MRAKSPRHGLPIGIFALVLVIGVALFIYLDDSQPPSHPESDSVVIVHPLVEWIWSGAVTTNSAVVKARLPTTVTTRLAVQDAPEMDAPRFFDVVRVADDRGIAEFALRGLEADTQYYYTLELDGQLDHGVEGRLYTFGEGAYNFTVAVGACASTGSNGAVFDTIRGHDPNFLLHLGDLHYENIVVNDPARFHDAYDRVLTAPAQALLYRAQPIVYVWDDHDFGSNNSSGASPAAEAARQAYGEAVPHYPLQQAAGRGINQAFSVGRVRFIITDARSQRDAKQATLLGAEQKAWLKEQLLSAKGGSYTVGPLPGGGQFALLRVTDTGAKLNVTLTGHDYLNNQLLGMTFEVDHAGISDLAVLE